MRKMFLAAMAVAAAMLATAAPPALAMQDQIKVLGVVETPKNAGVSVAPAASQVVSIRSLPDFDAPLMQVDWRVEIARSPYLATADLTVAGAKPAYHRRE